MENNDLEVYKAAMKIGELTWEVVFGWDFFEKRTLGIQWVTAADSIAANISEAEGRFNFPDRKRFYYISRGSLNESETWLTKSYDRKLISEEFYKEYLDLIDLCRKMINSCIKMFKVRINK